MINLEDLYRDVILDHYRSPRNRGTLPSPPAISCEGFNPLCGDEVTLFLDVKDGVLVDIKVTSQGCSISQASSSMMSVAVKGKTLSQVRDSIATFSALMTTPLGKDQGTGPDLRSLGDLAALRGVAKFPVRIKCAALAWDTLTTSLAPFS
jgi:nitrogen fixation protein NifU and related proteins